MWLDPGESRPVAFTLDDRAFAFWDVATNDWIVEPGEFELRIGTSSRDIRHRLMVYEMTPTTLTVGLANYGTTFRPASGTGSSIWAAPPRTPASTASWSSTTS